MDFPRFGVYQLWQLCFLGTLPYYLPGPMPVNAKDKTLCLVPSNKVSQHLQSVATNG